MIEDFSNKTTEQLFGTGVAGEGGTFFREVDASGFGCVVSLFNRMLGLTLACAATANSR